MELELAIQVLESMKNTLIEDGTIWEDGTCSQAIDTVLSELDNRISTSKIEQLINKINKETWYIESSNEAKQACIEELESLLNKE